MPDGHATILVVDDEDDILALLDALLGSEGFHVLSANSALVALRLCREHPEPIQLALLDVMMPGQSGPELRECLAREFPDIRVIFMSGYPYDELERRGIQTTGLKFIEKPFTASTLKARIREVLRADSSSASS